MNLNQDGLIQLVAKKLQQMGYRVVPNRTTYTLSNGRAEIIISASGSRTDIVYKPSSQLEDQRFAEGFLETAEADVAKAKLAVVNEYFGITEKKILPPAA